MKIAYEDESYTAYWIAVSRVYDRSWRSGTESASVPVASLRVGELCGIRGRQVTG